MTQAFLWNHRRRKGSRAGEGEGPGGPSCPIENGQAKSGAYCVFFNSAISAAAPLLLTDRFMRMSTGVTLFP